MGKQLDKSNLSNFVHSMQDQQSNFLMLSLFIYIYTNKKSQNLKNALLVETFFSTAISREQRIFFNKTRNSKHM